MISLNRFALGYNPKSIFSVPFSRNAFMHELNYARYIGEVGLDFSIIRGIDGDGLVELILKYYDGLSDKYKQLIPLQKVYIPNLKSE